MSGEDVTLTLGGDSHNLIDALSKGGDAFTEFAKKTTSNAESLAKKLREVSGTDVIGQANEYAKAVNLIGGSTKLTTDEKTKLNSSLAAALEKYQALGQEAPAALQKLARETEPLPKKLSLMSDLTARLGPAMVAAFSIGAVSKLLGDFTDLTGGLVDLEAKTGINVVALHKMKLVLEQSGVSLETAARASNEFQRRLADGDQSVLRALERLGINLTQLRAMKPEDQLFTIADAVGKVGDQGQKLSLLNDLYGKQGQELLPALNGRLKETVDAYARMGLVLDEDVIRSGDKLGDQWTVLKAAGSGLIGSVLSPFVPLLANVAGGITSVLTVAGPLLKWVIDISMPFRRWGESIDRATDSLELLGIKSAKLPAIHGDATAALEASRKAAESRMAVGLHMTLEEEERVTADLNRRVEESIKQHEKAAAAAEQHANKVKDLSDQLSGRKAQKDLADVLEAWRKLTAHEQQEPQNIAAVVAMYDQLRARLSPNQLPKDLEHLWTVAQAGFEKSKTIGFEDWMTFDKSDPVAPIVEGFEKLKDLGPLAFAGTFDHFFTDLPKKALSKMAEAGSQLPQVIAQAFTSGGGWQGALQGSASTIGAAAMGSLFGKAGVSGIAQGMSGMMGQVMQAAGPVIGALAGPLMEMAIKAFHKPEHVRIMQDVGKQWGVNISEGLAKQIEADAGKYFNKDRVAGTIFNLDKVIAEAGGLTSANYDKFVGKLRDVFSMFESGKFTAAQAAQVIDKNWGAFVAHATDGNGRVSDSLKQITAYSGRTIEATPNYYAQLEQFLQLVRSVGLTVQHDRGDMNALSFTLVRDHLATIVPIYDRLGWDSLAMMAAANEVWQNGDFSAAQMAEMLKPYRARGALVGHSDSSPAEEPEALAAISKGAPIYIVHGLRNGTPSLVMDHIFSLGYFEPRQDVQRLGWQREPTGPGAGVSVGRVEDREQLGLMAATSLLSRQAWNYMCGDCVFWNAPIERSAAFYVVPRIRAALQAFAPDLMSWPKLRHGGRADAALNSPTGWFGDPGVKEGPGRINMAISADRQKVVATVTGGSGRKAVRNVLCPTLDLTVVSIGDDESVRQDTFTLKQGESLNLEYRIGRLLLGACRP